MTAIKTTDAQYIERFKSYLVEQPNGCWEYSKARNGDGYGMFWHNGKTYGAHKFAALYLGGMTINKGDCVCHRCDNPACCNPEHLFIDTNQANTADRHRKGRSVRGSDVGTSKFSDDDIREIRRLYAAANGRRGILTQIAKAYGVSVTPIWSICHGLGWKHII